ncbi:hypothetical protein C8F01DRAFT_1256514 [Mycena amicta]|nr:hypothetical protein C8F01DRAFT_1256514 [Mycena amicta]
MKLALPERLWTPRLKSFDNDKRLAEASPLLELFSFRFSTRATIQSVLSSELAAVHEWWTWNIGDFFIPWVVTSSELNSLLVSQYIELLYQRCSLLIGDPEALKVLLAEQHFIYDFCESIPTQLNVFGKGDSDSSSSPYRL